MSSAKSNASLLRNQEKGLNHLKLSPIKAADGNNSLLGMVIKNSKPKISSSDSQLKYHSKTSEVKSLLNFKVASSATVTTNLNKRKNEKGDSIQKKIKAETSILKKTALSEDDIISKKINKFKSMYPKTYVCKFCCRRFYSEEYLQQHSKSHGNKTSHICYLCNHQTGSFSALMNHYLKHSGTKGNKLEKIYAKSKADYTNIQFNISSRPKPSFRCSKCKQSFNSKSKYESHNCSTEKSVYNCAYCGRVSSTIEEYRNCVQSHSETPFVCTYCKSKFQRKKQLDKHLEQCKPHSKVSQDFKCDICAVFVCESKKELDEHLKKCDKSRSCYICASCSSEFIDKIMYENHLVVCKPVIKKNPSPKKVGRPKKPLELLKKKKFPCSICGHIFNLKKECKEHEKHCLIEKVNPSVGKAYDECSTCGSLIEISKLFEHINTCLEKHDLNFQEKPLNSINSKMYLDKDDAIGKKSKNNLDDKTYSEQSDASVGKNSDEVDSKISDQNKTNTQKTSNIDDSFGTRRSARLVRRKSSFSEENEIVKKKRKSLKIKIRKPSKILAKPKFKKGAQSINGAFICNICDFSFCSKSTLLRHKRMHSGNPWYICQYCGKFFFRKDVYIRHETNVHSKETKAIFRCYYCKLSFSNSSLLKEHVLAEHKDFAFFPVRQRFSDKRSASTDKIKIKQESDSNDTDSMIDLNTKASVNNESKEALSLFSSAYKYNVLSQSLEDASKVAVHMDTDSKDSIEISNEMLCSPEIKEEHVFNVKEPISIHSNMSIDEPFCQPSSSTYLPEIGENNLNEGDNVIESFDTANNEQMLDSNLSTSDESKALVCMMCFQRFSDKCLLEAHNKTMHKIVDWYQCLVCSASGPKQDMQEHMFSHMFKVGTFVVNGNSKNFDSIISCLQLGDQDKVGEERTEVCKEAVKGKTPLLEPTDLIYDELPPLREFGMCPCVDSSCEQEQNKMPNLQQETDIVSEQNSSVNLKKKDFSENFNLFMNDTDKTNTEPKISVECESDFNLFTIDTDKFNTEPKKSVECKSSDMNDCTSNAVNTDICRQSNALEEEKKEQRYSSDIKTSDTRIYTDNLSTVHLDSCTKSNHILEEKKDNYTKERYSFECKTNVEKNCSDDNSILLNTDECIIPEGASEKGQAKRKSSTHLKNADTKKFTDNSIVMNENFYVKPNDVLEKKAKYTKVKEKYSFESSINITKNYPLNNPTRSTDMCLISKDVLEKKETKQECLTKFKVLDAKSYTDNSIAINKNSCMKSIDAFKEKEAKVKCLSQCNIDVMKNCTDNNGNSVSSDTGIKFNALEKREARLKFSSECETSVIKSCTNSNSIAFSTNTSIKKADVPLEEDSKLKRFHEHKPNFKPSSAKYDSSFSSQAKEYTLGFQLEEGINQSDYGTESFSQLRHLLQKPSKTENCDNKITIYPSSHSETSGCSQIFSNPFVKCISNIEEYNSLLPSHKNRNIDEVGLISENKGNLTSLPKQNYDAFNNSSNFAMQTSKDKDQSTCLKLDINQSRSQFSDNLVTSIINPKPQNFVYNKTDNLFKPIPSQSTILDFSDLIQHSFDNSSPCEDNIFSYSNSMKPVDFLSDVSNREEVHTPDCTNMVNYDCSTFSNSIKCEDCNVNFEGNKEFTNHKCLAAKPLHFAEMNLCKPKNIFQPEHYIENPNEVSCSTTTSEEQSNCMSPQKSVRTFVYPKLTSSETDIDRYHKSDSFLSAQNIEYSKCQRCHKTFRNIGELMKHSLTCLKSLFYQTSPTKKTSLSDCVTPTGSLHSLLVKDEADDSFSDISLNSVSSNTVSTEQSHLSTEDLMKHSFDS